MSRLYHHFPKTLQKLERRIKKFIIHPMKLRDDYDLYNNFNKSYKKFNWNREYIPYKECESILKDENFPTDRTLFDNGLLTKHHLNGEFNLSLSRKDLEEEFLRREVCAFIDSKLWFRNYVYQTKKKRRMKRGLSKVYKLRVNKKKLFILGKLPINLSKRIDIIKDFLLKHQYIFDKDSRMYMNDRFIRKMINRKMLYGPFDKFEEAVAEYVTEYKEMKKKKAQK